MNPSILGAIGPGFLNQVPILESSLKGSIKTFALASMGSMRMSSCWLRASVLRGVRGLAVGDFGFKDSLGFRAYSKDHGNDVATRVHPK